MTRSRKIASGVLESPGKVLEIYVIKRVGVIDHLNDSDRAFSQHVCLSVCTSGA